MEVAEEQEQEEEGSCEPKLKNLKEAIQCINDVMIIKDILWKVIKLVNFYTRLICSCVNSETNICNTLL